MRRVLAVALLVATQLVLVVNGTATAQQSVPILSNAVHLVVDTSGSMADPDPTGRIKLEGAKAALLQFLDGAQLGLAIGLRTYPDPAASDCNSGTLRFDVDRHDPTDVSATIRGLQPDGGTPTAEALRAAADDIRRSGFPSATLVVVSDGESTCDDPCEAASEINASGLNIEVITVGFRISDSGAEELRCIASVTNGRYLDIDDSEELEEILRDVSVPRLEIELDYPSTVLPEVGSFKDGLVTITAQVTNVGQASAVNAQVWIQFEDVAPGVIHPVRALGNIAAGTTANRMAWSFRPGLLLAGVDVPFSVVVRADNIPTDLGQAGVISVLDPSERDDAGPVLRGETIGIMGDSYSAGEGADEYFKPTDTAQNRCHRSPQTYAVESFEVDHAAIFACSGAVAVHITGRDDTNGMASQIAQLRAYQRDVEPLDALVLTIGGNDVGFADIAQTCFLGACDQDVAGMDPAIYAEQQFDGFATQLANTYQAIHATLNNFDAVERRRGIAPIIVLGYPRPVPTVQRTCTGLVNLDVAGVNFDAFTAAELTFAQGFITELNGQIEGAVQTAQERPAPVPVFFVPNVEDSFLPDHTVCDPEPYARGVDSFNGAAFDLNLSLGDFFEAMNPFQTFVTRMKFLVRELNEAVLARSINELMHPNATGYDAMTRALIRWSVGPEASAIEDFVETVDRPTEPLGVVDTCDDSVEPERLAELPPTLQLQTCAPYTLTVTGFAPGTNVQLVVRSSPRTLGWYRVGNDGTVNATFRLPGDLEVGSHELLLSGRDVEFEHREVISTFVLDPESSGPPAWIVIVGLLFLAGGAGLLFTGRRRPRRYTPIEP